MRPTWSQPLVLAAAAVRVAAELPAILAYRGMVGALTAMMRLACIIPWAARYVPMYWQPRADRRPG